MHCDGRGGGSRGSEEGERVRYLQLPDHVFKLNLTALELKLYCDVWTMTASGKAYWKSNATIASQFDAHRSTVIRAINKLESRSLLRRVESENGRYLEALISDEGSSNPATGSNIATGRNPATRGSKSATGGVATLQQSSSRPATQIENNREVRIEKLNRDSASLKFPWNTSEFRDAWNEWTEFRRDQFKFTYKTIKSEQLALHKLHKESHGRQEVAIDAIAESIAGGYRGLRPKPDSQGQQPGKSNSWARAIREKYQRNPEYNSSQHDH